MILALAVIRLILPFVESSDVTAEFHAGEPLNPQKPPAYVALASLGVGPVAESGGRPQLLQPGIIWALKQTASEMWGPP